MLAANPELQELIRQRYSVSDVERIRDLLFARGSLSFPALPSGLFPAVPVSRDIGYTGYHAVWVRDNVHVAHSLLENGEVARAVAAVLALADHFHTQSARFDAIIADPSRAADPTARPHVKFQGYPIREIPHWPHDQNDALGYFLWIFSRMARLKHIALSENHRTLLSRFVRYFEAIQFWSDADSGHWEEVRKNSASSVGTVCAGLRELRALLESDQSANPGSSISVDSVEGLLETGLNRLHSILPSECIEEPPLQRRYDSALLFLVYPLAIVDGPMADRILGDIRQNLQGDRGIKRYLGDSFWCENYRRNMRAADRTRDFSKDMHTRDRLFQPGREAEWCIFDPIVSVAFGRRYETSGDSIWLALQTEHFNRALSQLTPELRCPELWHWEMSDDGARFPDTSDSTPLLWTQANLWLALNHMRKSLSL